jgi:hypothetical protein
MTTFDPEYNAQYPPIRQTVDWTCSACSWGWLANAIGQHETEWSSVERIGFPANINPAVGLADASGQALAAAYSETFSWPSHYSAEVTLSDMIALGWAGPALLGGRGWYHWTAVTGTDGSGLMLANPAPTWMGVGDYLDHNEWARLGPWSAVWLAA